MNKDIEKLKTALTQTANAHGVIDFICIVTFEESETEQTVYSITDVREDSPFKSLFQWLRRQVILKLQ